MPSRVRLLEQKLGGHQVGKLAKAIAKDLIKFAQEQGTDDVEAEYQDMAELDTNGMELDTDWEEDEEETWIGTDDEDDEEWDEDEDDDWEDDDELEESADDYDLYTTLFEYPLMLGSFLLQCGELLDKYPELRQHQMFLMGAMMEYGIGESEQLDLGLFFNFWSYFDAQIGNSGETLATLVRETAMNDENELGLDILNVGIESRMGLYVHEGHNEHGIKLRELVTGQEATIVNVGPYQGEQGQVWFIRILPPLENPILHTLVTMPYIFEAGNRPAVEQFVQAISKGKAENYAQFMKYGPSPSFWLDYLHSADRNIDSQGVVFLSAPPKL
jgi:hypothetical protein